MLVDAGHTMNILVFLYNNKHLASSVEAFLAVEPADTAATLDFHTKAHFKAVFNVLFNSKIAQYYGTSNHFKFMRSLVVKDGDYLSLFAKTRLMINLSLPQFLSKSAKKIREFVSFKGEYLDAAAVDSIVESLMQNIPASQCHAERNLGVMTYIAFSGGRAYHTTIEGKCLWTLNHTYSWYKEKERTEPALFAKLMSLIDGVSRRRLEAQNKQKHKAMKAKILSEEEKQIEEAKKKKEAAEVKRQKETAVAILSPRELQTSLRSLSATKRLAKLYEQLRHFKQLVKNKELNFKEKICFSSKRKKKSIAELTDLHKRCHAAYARERQS